MFTKKFDRRVHLAVAVLIFSLILGASFGTYALWPANVETGYEPEQPLAFSHRLHAGELQINCRYCHSRAETSPHATVPELAVCMNCHRLVKPTDEKGHVRPALAYLLKHVDANEPIRWQKVNDLADFVYFDHSRHLAFGLDCQDCHGPVQEMDVVRRVYSLKMGWCLDCHKKPGTKYHQDGRGTQAPINCSTCHR